MCAGLFESSARLLKSYPVHPLVYLLAQLLDNFINFIAAFILLLIPVWLADPSRAFGLLLLPAAMVVMIAGVFGMTWLLAIGQVFLRDTRFVLGFFFSISYFLTPVFYPVEFVPAKMRWMVTVNPFYHLIDPFRAALYDPSGRGFLRSLSHAMIVAGLFLGLAYLTWRRKRNVMYLYL
jgi:ABC-type polysaccharide/polyol phosphate export permease